MSFAGEEVAPGETKKISIHVSSLYDGTDLSMPIEVIRGVEPGPVLFVSAAIHGDELNGIEIIRRLLKRPSLKKIKGTLIAVPVVNVFGLINRSRYLPDRRDLNRCFPGEKNGTLAGQLAKLFMKEVVKKCTHGIDLHTAAINRTNLSQIRAWLDNPETRALAKSFGVPVVVNSKLRDGSLREAARKRGVSMLLFEGGSPLRFEEDVIRIGVKGCINVMRSIKMLPKVKKKDSDIIQSVFTAKSSQWLRAPCSGICHHQVKVGDRVEKGQVLAMLSNPFGEKLDHIEAVFPGIVIGLTTIPLVTRGEAIFHIALFSSSKLVKTALEEYDEPVN